MSAFAPLWHALIHQVLSGNKSLKDISTVAQALAKAVDDERNGVDNPLASIEKNYPEAIPLIEAAVTALGDAVGTLFPPAAMAGPLLKLAFAVTSMMHPMKPGSVEEKRWFDRASGGPGKF